MGSDGTIVINLISGSTLPTLHFHDDESLSTSPTHRQSNLRTYPPSASHSFITWGGEDLLSRLRCYAHILRSNLQTSLFLVDPSKSEIESHSTPIFDDNAVDDILTYSSNSPVPAHRRPRLLSAPSTSIGTTRTPSALHQPFYPPSVSMHSTSDTRRALIQSFSNITRATRHAAQNILSHPLAKPIVHHLPDPVKSLVNVNGECDWGRLAEKGGVGEFEAARVYLARWARIVAEEGERARRREAQALPDTELEEETSSLGVFELLQPTVNLPLPKSSREPWSPVDEKMWESWFDAVGRPNVRMEVMKKEVFRRGINPSGTLRKHVWPFILGVHAWDIDAKERNRRWEDKRCVPSNDTR